MAIHIDIYAHLRRSTLIKEGEELRRYLRKLENESNRITERGAEGRSKQIVALNNRTADSYDSLVNAIDDVGLARRRAQKANKRLLRLQRQEIKEGEEGKKQRDAIIAAERAREAALAGLAVALQRVNKANRAYKTNEKNLNDENKKFTKNLGDVTRLTKKNRKEFTQLARFTNKLRRETESLHTANIDIVKDNVQIEKSTRRVQDATKKTKREKEAYKNLLKKEGVTGKEVEKQALRIIDAHESENRAVADLNRSLKDAIEFRQKHDDVVDQSKKSLQGLAFQASRLNLQSDRLRISNERVIDQNSALKRQFDRVGEATKKASREYFKYMDMANDTSVSGERLKVQLQRSRDAFDAQRRSVEDASRALEDYHAKEKQAEREKFKRFAGRQSPGQYLARNLGALTPLGTLSPSAILPVVAIFATVAEAVVTASQALALLPAVSYAAAAGIGTLVVGMKGFGDALGSMDDPKKFAEALYQLSPNAQQAALRIKELVDGPLGELKAATQDALFADVGATIQRLTATFGPAIRSMTTSIATSFNEMFTGISFRMMTPENQARINTITSNIAEMFERLRPAVLAFNNAFVKLGETGSGFLPRLADGLTRAMQSFDEFISKAQADGSLENFIDKGIDAIKAISEWLLKFGQQIYNVFGNKSPEEFIKTLDDLQNLIIGLFRVFGGLAKALEPLLTGLDRVVAKIGGWEVAFYGLIAIWTSAKAFAALKFIKEFATVFGLVGSGAATAAGGVGKIGTAFRTAFGIALPAAVAGGGKATLDTAKKTADGAAKTFASAGKAAGTGFASSLAASFKGAIGKVGWFALGAGVASQVEAGLRSQGTKPNGDLRAPGEGNIFDALADGFNPGKVLNWSWWLDRIMLSLGRDNPESLPPHLRKQLSAPGEGSDLGALGQPFALETQPYYVPDFPDLANLDLPGLSDGVMLDENGKAMSESDILDVLRGQLPRESYAVDPFTDPITGQKLSPMLPIGPNGMPEYPAGGVPGTPSIKGPVMPQYNEFGQFTGYGANMVDPEEVFDAQLAVQDKARDLEEARKDLLAGQQSNLLTAEEINDLERKVYDEKLGLHKALVRLGEAQAGDVKKLKDTTNSIADALGEFGAALDNDFGISRGLSGIAENLTKFLANLAFAPAFGAIRGAQAGMGFPKGEGVGHGFAGVMSANMGYYKGGPLDPGRETGGDGWTPSYRNPATTTGDVPLAAEAGYKPTNTSAVSANILKFNPNNTSTAGLKPQSLALLGLIQGMPQFANVTLGSAKVGREGDKYPWHGHGQGLDFNLNANDPQQSRTGDLLQKFLLDNKEILGVNHVLWKTMQGGNHFNHLHVGLNGSSIGKPDTSPLLEALGGKGSLAGLIQPGSTALLGGGSIPIPLPVTIVGGSVPGPAPSKPPAPKPPAPKEPTPSGGKPGWKYGPDGKPLSAPAGTSQDEFFNAVADWYRIRGQQPPPAYAKYGTPNLPGLGLGGPFSPPAFPPVDMPGFAKGGEVPIMAHSGEHVLTREDVAALGGQAGVYNFRQRLHRYDVGGAVDPNKAPDPLGGFAPFSEDPFDPSNVPKPPKPDPLGGFAPFSEDPFDPSNAPKVPPAPAAPAVPETALPGGVETPGTVIGAEVEAPAGYGEGFSISGGGLLGMAQDAAVSAAAAGGMMGGGGGGPAAAAALQTAMKLINRGIEYGGQVAAISAQGMLETFLPAGGSELAQNNWATRWLGGIAGAAPAIANLAGGNQASNQSMLAGVGPTTAEQIAAQNMNAMQPQAAAPAGPTTNNGIGYVENYIIESTEDRGGQDLVRHMPAPGAR